MEANKIINSITSILNEDKFSKYTISQIYDELGKEDFLNYIDDIVKKTIKNIEGLSQAELQLEDKDLTYTQKTPEEINTLTVRLIYTNFLGVSITSKKYITKNTFKLNSKHFTLHGEENETNTSVVLKTVIRNLCKQVGL